MTYQPAPPVFASRHTGSPVSAWMGDTITSRESTTLQVKLPQNAECHLIKDGERVLSAHQRDSMIYIVDGPGVYRVEAYLEYKKERRGWIFSNPIYVK